MTDERCDDSDILESSTRRRDLPRGVWVLVLARAVNRLGGFTLAFLAVVLVEDLGASVAAAGWAMAAFGLATIPSRLVGGRLADRLGRVPTICLGLVACAAAQLWVAASPTLALALIGVIVLGAAFELHEPPSQALVADLTTEAERPLAYGLLGAALTLAGAGAGMLALVLGALDLRWLLVADALTCLLTAGLVAVAVREPGPRGPGGSQPDLCDDVDPVVGDAGGSPWRDRRLLALLAAGTGFAIVYLTVVVSLPLVLSLQGIAPERAGLVLTVSAVTVVLATPLLRLPALQGDGFRALGAGYAVLAVGLAAMAAAGSITGYAVAAVVWSVGDLLVMGHAWTLAAELAPPASRGRYLAAYGLSWGVAAVVAPVLGTRLLGTQLLGLGGVEVLWLSLAAGALVLAVSQRPVARVCRPRPGPVPAR